MTFSGEILIIVELNGYLLVIQWAFVYIDWNIIVAWLSATPICIYYSVLGKREEEEEVIAKEKAHFLNWRSILYVLAQHVFRWNWK